MEPLLIDGSQGEGGGQILRSSLSLSAITGRPIVLQNIRPRRERPGLQRQHLAAVKAAQTVCAATVDGAELGSKKLRFTPGPVSPGAYHFDIGSAGSATLVLQTVLPPLLLAGGPSRVAVVGGTLNPMAPPFDFVERVFLPALRHMGARAEVKLERHGFYPRGGGQLVLQVQPSPLTRFDALEVKPPRARSARVLLARLADHIGNRELGVVRAALHWREDECRIERIDADSPGNALLLELEREPFNALASAIGERGLRAEAVAEAAVRELKTLLNVAVGEHLADQLLLPMAIGAGGSFRTGPLSPHTRTNIDVIQAFGLARFTVEEDGDGVVVAVESASR